MTSSDQHIGLAFTQALADQVTYAELRRHTGDHKSMAVCVGAIGQARLVVEQLFPRLPKVPAESVRR